jgi:PAS domain S-box-containing protein
MIAPKKHKHEEQRIKSLYDLEILDTTPEQAFDDIVKIASQICEVPIALISLIDIDRQWFKSKIGIDAQETSRDLSFCGHAILKEEEVLIVENATRDERFFDNPLVTDNPHIRFYAGAPIVTQAGESLGTICVIDSKEKKLTQQQIFCLQSLAREAAVQIELRSRTKKLEQLNTELRISEARYKTLSDAAPLGIFHTDARGMCTYVNEKYSQISGLPFEECLGEGWSQAIHKEDRDLVYKKWYEAAVKDSEFQSTHRFVRSDESVSWCNVKAASIKEQGKIVGYIGTTDDITEQKLQSEKLIIATKAKSDFLAKMSHEIRTPMNGILGMAELLFETNLDTDQKTLLRDVDSSARILLEIINDILDLSKIEAGHIELNPVNFSLQKLVDQYLATQQVRADKKHIQIRSYLDKEIPEILFGDELRLRQVLINLVSNAIKFTPEHGFIDIQVKLHSQTESSIMLHVTVTDSGIGIPADKLESIFTPFIQADGSTTRNYGGTGLGLSICRELCRLMGGEISVTSKINEGSSFHCTVSLQLQTESETNNKPFLELNNQKLFSNNQKPRLLVAEDNDINQRLIARILEKIGCEVVLVKNGQQVLDTLENEEEKFSLILMDCQMPVLNGYDATDLIRKAEIDTNRHIPIVAMTANAMIGDREECLKAGMDEYLSKPIQRKELENILARFINPLPEN